MCITDLRVGGRHGREMRKSGIENVFWGVGKARSSLAWVRRA